MKYFKNFPIIEYQGRRVKDITRRTQFVKDVSTNPYLHMPYTVKDGERPEDIAQYYYGSVDYIWLVYLANAIIDPYHEWPKSQDQLHEYLIDKYEDIAEAEGYEILNWLQSEDTEDNIVYYYRPAGT